MEKNTRKKKKIHKFYTYSSWNHNIEKDGMDWKIMIQYRLRFVEYQQREFYFNLGAEDLQLLWAGLGIIHDWVEKKVGRSGMVVEGEGRRRLKQWIWDGKLNKKMDWVEGATFPMCFHSTRNYIITISWLSLVVSPPNSLTAYSPPFQLIHQHHSYTREENIKNIFNLAGWLLCLNSTQNSIKALPSAQL